MTFFHWDKMFYIVFCNSVSNVLIAQKEELVIKAWVIRDLVSELNDLVLSSLLKMSLFYSLECIHTYILNQIEISSSSTPNPTPPPPQFQIRHSNIGERMEDFKYFFN